MAAVITFVGGYFCLPYLAGSTRSFKFQVVTNLEQIENAKAMFASDLHVPIDYTPTLAQLTPYLSMKNGKFPSVGPERYVINNMTNAPYAYFTNGWWIPRHGFQEGRWIVTNGGTIRLPARSAAK